LLFVYETRTCGPILLIHRNFVVIGRMVNELVWFEVFGLRQAVHLVRLILYHVLRITLLFFLFTLNLLHQANVAILGRLR